MSINFLLCIIPLREEFDLVEWGEEAAKSSLAAPHRYEMTTPL